MAKKSRSDSPRHKNGLWVIRNDGSDQRFLRGVLTHHLMLRGFDFDDAYAIARALRDRLSDRHEVTTSELRDLLYEHVETTFGGEAATQLLRQPAANEPLLTVSSRLRSHPFSRGLLARSIHAAGIDHDRAYRLITDLEGELRREGVRTLSSDEVARRVGDLLERHEGKGAARRYRMVRRMQRLPKPLVVYIGGASGTGKSTLALELAPLLRIYRVTATDSIRQVMRSLISPSILPSIHGSSFEAQPTSNRWLEHLDIDSEPQHEVIASFLEQAVRVGVGVRAVVERAVAENTSALVEGVHLIPQVVPFHDLDGACYQVPLLLGLSDVEEHRSRFLKRSWARRAEHYVRRFDAIRTLHDFVLEQAESEDIPFLDTSGEAAAPRALRMVAAVLQKRLPALEPMGDTRPPVLLLALDGVADQPVRALGGRTPLEAATTPTLDRLAAEGASGLADPVAPGIVPDTAAGTLALLGQSPSALKRGPVEALGAGFELAPGDIAFRANFATVGDADLVVDRRAGRVREGAPKLARALDRLKITGDLAGDVARLGIDIRVVSATEHRLAVILRGDGLSSAVRGSDPGEAALPTPPLVPRAQDPSDAAAVLTARVLERFEKQARKVLREHPINRRRRDDGKRVANCLLTRGAGRIHRLEPLEVSGVPLRLHCVAGDQTVRGIAGWLGAELSDTQGMTANLDTDLERKFELARKALSDHDLVVLHLKGADIAAHDRRADLKAQYLEKADRALGTLLKSYDGPLRVVVASDHATLSETGNHAADPVPVLMWGPGIEPDEVTAYTERAAGAGVLQRFPLQLLIGRLFDLP